MATVAERILEQIKASPRGLKTKEIAERLKVPSGSVTGRSSELAKAGLLERRDGAYYLKTASKIKTHYVLLIDKSTSMAGQNDQRFDRRPSVAQLFNKQLQELRASENDVTVQTVFFAGGAGDVGRGYADIVTGSTFAARQALIVSRAYPVSGTGTGLLDALVKAMTECDASDATAKTVFCFTDGEENNSRTTWPEFTRALRERQAKGDFTLAILVPKNSPGEAMLKTGGVPEANILPWDNIDEAEKIATQSTQTFEREVKTSGGATRHSVNYFKADLSRVSAADLNDLTEIASQVKTWRVESETDIETFLCEKQKRSGGIYIPGTGFFEYMKREKRVPGDRKLLLYVPQTGRVYADGTKTVRALCGYPENQDIAVEPGNHAGFVILGQSKSSAKDTFRARILPRGTRVILWPGAVS